MRSSTVAALLQIGLRDRDDWEDTLENVLRIAGSVLEVGRTSYWSLREDPPSIVCELGYDRHGDYGRMFERGTVLLEHRCPAYFHELRTLQALVIDDARDDPRVRGLEPYLERHGIGALLDVPIFVRGRQEGLLCHEHVGSPRRWTEHDQEFVLAVSQAVAAALEARARCRAEDEGRRSAFLARSAAALAETFARDDVARVAVRQALPVLGDACALLERGDGDEVHVRAALHRRTELQPLVERFARAFPLPLSADRLSLRAIRDNESLLVSVVDADSLREAGYDAHDSEILLKMNIRSAMAVPLHARGRVLGALIFASECRTYEGSDLRTGEAFAREVAMALNNTRLYEQAQKAIRARDEFLRLASHELRTPLTALSLSAEGLLRLVDGRAPKDIVSISQSIARQVGRLERLTTRILDAAEIGLGSLRLQREDVDLAVLVRDIAGSFLRAVERTGGELVVHADRPVTGRWDPTRLEQLVNNLLDNALKFGAGRPIEVTVEASDGCARLSVRDHGIGIDTRAAGEIFERYQRAVDTRSFGGLGLGLHVVREIAEAHGGTVSVDNLDSGGASFIVELPRSEVPGA